MDDYSLVLILAFPHSASAAQIKAAELEQSKIVQEYARQNHVENLFTLGRASPAAASPICTTPMSKHWKV